MRITAICVALSLGSGLFIHAQSTSANSGTIRGTVLDPSGAAIPGATVEIQNPVSGYNKSVKADPRGNFELDNIRLTTYHLTRPRRDSGRHTNVNVRSPFPLEVKIYRQARGRPRTSVTVTEASDLVESRPYAHTDVDRDFFKATPRKASSSLSSLGDPVNPRNFSQFEWAFPRVRRSRLELIFLDGQPITDQQSKVFSNQIPTDAVQSMEVIQGAPPAEYGDKTSVVIVVTTRSGLGTHPRTATLRPPMALSERQMRALISLMVARIGAISFCQRYELRPFPGWSGEPGLSRPW